MIIRLDSNLKQVSRKYRKFGSQIPFAASQTINKLAIRGRPHEADQMIKNLDRPTPFTVGRKKGNFLRQVKKSTKASLTNIQEIKTKQAEYLRWQIFGGTQTASNAPGNKRGGRILVPTSIQPRDGHGNVTAPKYRKVVETTNDRDDLWRKNQAGIFRRYKSRNDELRFTFERSVRYRARYAFGAGYVRYIVAQKAFEKTFNREIKKAIATAK